MSTAGFSCGMIPRLVMKLTVTGKIALAIAAVLAITVLVFAGFRAFRTLTKNGKPEPIWNDKYSLYILDPGPFVPVEVEYPAPREFLILKNGEVEISCGTFPGAYFKEAAGETSFAQFATDTIQHVNWLTGCRRWELDAADTTIGTRAYYYVTLLIRRDPEWTSSLNYIERAVHKHEIERFPNGEDQIVRMYYTYKERPDDPTQGDIYIFTLSGPPEDVAVNERSVRRLFASVYLDASSATLASGGR